MLRRLQLLTTLLNLGGTRLRLNGKSVGKIGYLFGDAEC
jgi:hypothetical protein